jgi:hypothetical protein
MANRWDRIGEHDDGIIDANLGVHQSAGSVKELPQLDGTKDTL